MDHVFQRISFKIFESGKEKKMIHHFDFYDFSVNRQPPKHSDLVRSWTFRDEHDELQITNGLMLLQPQATLEIRKAN